MKSKIFIITLVFILAFSCLAGCAATGDSITEASVTPEPEVTYETQIVEHITFDYEAAYNMFEPNSVVYTVDGTEITWKEYFGWLYNVVMQYEMYYGAENVWDAPSGVDESMEESFISYAELMSAQYAIVNNEAKLLELELSDEDKKSIDDSFTADAEYYTEGDIDAFKEFLEITYMDEDYYRYIIASGLLYNKLFENLYGSSGEYMSDEEVYDYIEANDYLYAKHILFLTTDGLGAPLDDTAKADKLKAAQDTLAKLESISDRDTQLAEFDKLMNALSEDTGLASYPDGYYFLPGEMVTEFEEGTKALDYYSISGIIESPYGYHIILRLPISPDAEYQSGMSFRALASASAFDLIMGEKFNNAEIIYSDEFASLNLNEIFTTTVVAEEILVPVEVPVIEEPEEDPPHTSFEIIKNTENIQKLSAQEAFFLVAIISILVYTIPVFVYRFKIKKEALENRAAIKFTLIYGIIMLAIISTVLVLTNYAIIAIAVLIWSYINYYVLTSKG